MSSSSHKLAAVQFLREHGVKTMAEKFSLKYKRHKKHPNLILFKYDQIRSPFAQQVVQECRGLIVDEEDNFNVVCYPYKKFFNHGEVHAHPIDWSSATIYDKVDGSLASLYFYKGEWWVSSSGTPDATCALHFDLCGDLKEFLPATTYSNIFADIFWELWRELNYKMPEDTTKCYMFEMFTMKNVIIVRPEKDALLLHGVRDLITLEECPPEPVAQHHSWICANRFPLSSLGEVVKMANELPAGTAEGFVVVDKHFNRIKIKSEKYVEISFLKNGLNAKKLIKIVQKNEGEEVVAYFPEMKDLLQSVKDKYIKLADHMQEVYQQIHEKREKESLTKAQVYQEAAKYPKYCRILMTLLNGKGKSALECLSTQNEKDVEEMLLTSEKDQQTLIGLMEQITTLRIDPKGATSVENS